ncbi:tetratricopeptide repeat protein [Roseimicrobium sp. ORNL1]|uniref:tetratricopeptide repeat protein n=1 Tax=Roseimicrobium sp. ORNL1 TaxID=2711231 RepID=UPI0013E1C0C4|nr:tetratricopeptide repeat protein [Roseimicrobium sp. ORNL1]QIF01348.1 tetratricopeptide repeat protein [Roseimicrobium sp. ORNL1]
MKQQVATFTQQSRPQQAVRHLVVLLAAGMVTCGGIISLYAGPSVERRHTGREIIRTQGWASVPYWRQLRDQADSLMGWGIYDRAAKAYEFADAVLVTQKGMTHPDTLRNRVDLADALLRLGKPEGEKKLIEAYGFQRKHLAADDPDILRTRHLLASLMIARWQLPAAEKELKAVIALRAKRLGPGHSDTLSSRENLAYVYNMMLDYEAAEQQLRVVLAADILTFGPMSLQTCATRERLGECFQNQSKFDQALAEFRAVMMIVEDEFGPRHPLTFRAHRRLAKITYDQGKHEQAEEEYRALAANLLVTLGPDSWEVLPFREGIADCLSARGKLAEAEEILRKALANCAKDPGETTPLMQSLRANLAHVLMEERKLDEAELLFNAVLDQRTKMLGPNHPVVLDSMNDLAACKIARGDLRGAEFNLRGLVRRREEVQGYNHPATWFSRIYLADVLRMNGNPEEALPLFEGVLRYNSATLGPFHPYTLKAVNNVSITLSALGKEEESFNLQNKLLKERIRVMGADHPDTLKSRLNIAVNLSTAERYRDAEINFIEAILTAEKTLGMTHMLTLKSMFAYGEMLALLRRGSDAEAVARQGIRSTTGFSEDDQDALRFKAMLGVSLVLQNRAKDAEAVADDYERLLERRQGLLDWEAILNANMVIWVHLAEGRNKEAGELLARNMMQMRSMGYNDSHAPYIRMRCIEALLLHLAGKKEEVAYLTKELEPHIRECFRDGEPILLFARGLQQRKGPISIPTIMHAVEFSRYKPQSLLTDQQRKAGMYFPPNTPFEQRRRVYEAFDEAQTLADSKEHEKALEKFGAYLKVVAEVAGEGTIGSMTAHLCLAREAVLCNRDDVAQEHAKKAAGVLKNLGEEKGVELVTFVLKNLAVQAERGNIKAATTLGNMLLEACSQAIGPDQFVTFRLTSIKNDMAIMANEPGAGEELQALIKRMEAKNGSEEGGTLLEKVKLLRLYLQKGDYHAAHALAFRIENPVKRVFGETSDSAISVREGLAAALEGQGLRNLAVTETKMVLADSERIAGNEALATVMTRHRLALMLARSAQFDEALRLHQINYKILQHPGTEKQPVMVEVRMNMAYALLNLRRPSEALEFAKAAYDGARATLGADSPLTDIAKKILDEVRAHAASQGVTR